MESEKLRMRICFIADSNSIHTQRIVGYNVRKGDDILVLSTSLYRSEIPGTKTILLLENKNPLIPLPQQERKRKIGFSARIKSLVPFSLKVWLIWIIRIICLLHRRRFCIEEIQRFNPDVIYCFRSSAEGLLASYCHVRPLVLRTAGPDISKLPKYPVFRQLIRRTLKNADVVITESIWEKELLRKFCGSTLTPEVIIIGVDTDLFKPPASRDRLRTKYNLPQDAFVIVSNRALDGHYNGWLVVEAVQSVLEECPKLVLLYATPSKMGFSTKQRAEAITSRSPRIKFLDHPVPHAQVPEILGCGDIYISASSYDGVPNSVLEAMACGVVPIVAELPQLHEWIEHDETGYLVPQDDVGALASMVRHVYLDKEKLPVKANRCTEKIRKYGNYEQCMRRNRDLLMRLASSGSRVMNGKLKSGAKTFHDIAAE